MTDKKKFLQTFEKEYIPKIYGFCRLKMNTVQDAEDLSQDICLEVLKSINSVKKIDNLNAFVWSVSNHMFYNYLRKQKYGSTAYLTDMLMSEDDVESEYILREQKELLRRELAMMSGCYRKAVVMHYFDGLSCGEVGKAIGKSAGTVKWWLHEARNVIEKGMNTMREYGERSFRPGALFMSCQGTPGLNYEPMSCAKRKSAQNILLTAYHQPMTIEELCAELGISAPYVEDEVEYLTQQQLMREVSKGKYQTDFVILPGNNVSIVDKIYESNFPQFSDKMISFLESKKDILSGDSFNLAGFTWNRLLWVYIHIITEMSIDMFKVDNNIIVVYDDIPNRPQGGKWIALGFENDFTRVQPEWKDYHPSDGPVHKTIIAFTQGFFHKWSGIDSSIFFDTPDSVFELCREIIKGNASIDELSEEQKYLFSIALEKKLFVKDGDSFKQNYYFVGQDERWEIEKFAREFYAMAEPHFRQAYDIVLDEYLPGIPKHLHWQMGNFLSNHLNKFVTCTLYDAIERNLLSYPDEDNRAWLSLFASE